MSLARDFSHSAASTPGPRHLQDNLGTRGSLLRHEEVRLTSRSHHEAHKPSSGMKAARPARKQIIPIAINSMTEILAGRFSRAMEWAAVQRLNVCQERD